MTHFTVGEKKNTPQSFQPLLKWLTEFKGHTATSLGNLKCYNATIWNAKILQILDKFYTHLSQIACSCQTQALENKLQKGNSTEQPNQLLPQVQQSDTEWLEKNSYGGSGRWRLTRKPHPQTHTHMNWEKIENILLGHTFCYPLSAHHYITICW